MDLVKTAVFAAGAFVITNLLLGFTVGTGLPYLYLLPSFLAGLVASAYHAHMGEGGWVRHCVAVFLVPVVLGAYWAVVQAFQGAQVPVLTVVGALGTAVAAAALGMGVVMAVRWLLTFRSTSDESVR
ncbi:hypothetical protein ACUXNS_000475 [Brevibacterium pityocampae]